MAYMLTDLIDALSLSLFLAQDAVFGLLTVIKISEPRSLTSCSPLHKSILFGLVSPRDQDLVP